MDVRPRGGLLGAWGANNGERWVRTDISPCISFIVDNKIRRVEDLMAYRYLVEDTKYVLCYAVFAREDAYMGDDGLPTTMRPSSLFSPFKALGYVCDVRRTLHPGGDKTFLVHMCGKLRELARPRLPREHRWRT